MVLGLVPSNTGAYLACNSASSTSGLLKDSYFLPAYNLNISCDGVNTDNIPGIFCLIPELVKNEVTVENTFAYTVLSLNGSKEAAKLTSFPSLAYLIRSEAIISAKLSVLESVPNALTMDCIITFWKLAIDCSEPSVNRALTAPR